MPELTDAGRVERREDGSLVFTHGHRFPDNTQQVVQEYGPAGRLRAVRVEVRGFAGVLLNVRASVDDQGRVGPEEGQRVPEMQTPLRDFIKPLPEGTLSPAARAEVTKSQTAGRGLRAALEEIYGPARS